MESGRYLRKKPRGAAAAGQDVPLLTLAYLTEAKSVKEMNERTEREGNFLFFFLVSLFSLRAPLCRSTRFIRLFCSFFLFVCVCVR